MCELGRLSEVVGDIYDAALDPSRWTCALGKTARFVGGPAACLVAKDAVGNIRNDVFGISAKYQRLYLDQGTKLDPSELCNLIADAQELIGAADIIPYDQFLETRFYREWARPQGFVDFVAAILDKAPASVAAIGVFRHERGGAADAEARRRMRLVVPHFRRAVLVARSFELKSTQAATLAGMLDGLTVSIVLVDAHGAIVHANGAGRAMLEAGEVLCTTRGRIAATSLEAQSPLLEALAAASSGDVAVGDSIALPAPEKQTYVAHVLPLRSEQRHGNPLAATAALFVHKAVPPVRPPSGAIAKYYKLTPTELRVLLTTVEMGSVADVAKALGIAESTVKTHLGRLYGKTGTSGQVDLVKLVARFSTPLLC